MFLHPEKRGFRVFQKGKKRVKVINKRTSY